MATVKKSKKKKVITIIAIILVIALAVTSVVIIKKKNSGEEVSLNTISTGNIYEKVSSTGTVSSGTSRDYKVGTVATVKEVFVKVGDKVKKGDMLATFDTTNLDSQIAKLNSTYKSANSAYKKALVSQKQARKNLKNVNKNIAKLNKEIAKISNTSETTTNSSATTTSTKTVLTTVTIPTTTTSANSSTYIVKAQVLSGQESYGTVAVGNNSSGSSSSGSYVSGSSVTLKATPATGYLFIGWYDENGNKVKSIREIKVTVNSNINYIAQFKKASASSITDLTQAITEIANSIEDMTDDVNTMLSIIKVTSDVISKALSSDITDPKVISAAVENGIIEAINDGVINTDKLNVAGETLAKSIANTVKNIDWKTVAKDFANTKNISLTTKQLQLAALNIEQEMYAVEASNSVVSPKKEIRDTAKDALNILKESSSELQAGWKASFDGTITACDLTPGEQTSVISKGIKLENTNSMSISISLGEYDNHKVKVGMPCTITTAYGKYEGEIASKAPTATGGSSTSSILDNVGSMAGISGLSSLTSSGAGVECTVKVDNPDDNIVIGFDADVEVQTGKYLGVVVVPIESIVLEKTGTYVYLYNDNDKTVTKTKIKTGAISDSAYQVTSGLKVGDKIVAAPSSDYKENTFKVKVVDKK